jgi:transposase
MDIHSMKVAGIDTGKDELCICFLPGDICFKASNDAAGIALLVERCLAAGIVRAGIEATSIYHRKAAEALRAAGIETAELQPRQVRAFATALLQWSKTDPIDANVIARLTQVLDKVRPGKDGRIEAFAEHLTFIEHLEERMAWLKTSLERFEDVRFREKILAEVKALRKSRLAELRLLEAALRQDKALALRLDLLLSIGGVGLRTALGFLIRMPELGSMSREQAARLAGLAPCDDTSAKRTGERHIFGGRARLRKTAFMAAFAAASHWNPDLKAYYKHLRQRGKAHTSAVTACARKLIILANTILQRQTPWQDKRGTPCLEK